MEFMFYHEQTRSTVHLACYKIACALAAQLKFITAPTIPMVFPSKIPCEHHQLKTKNSQYQQKLLNYQILKTN